MASSTIGSAVVEVTAKGLTGVLSSLNTVKSGLFSAAKATGGLISGIAQSGVEAAKATVNFENLQKTINRIGTVSIRAFAVGTGLISAFVRAADPVGFSRFTGAMGALSVQVGSIFIPIIERATQLVEMLVRVFRGMSNEQKDLIANVTALALALLGGLAVFGKLSSVLGPVISLVVGLGSALAPVAAIAAVVAGGLYAIGLASNKTGEDLGILGTLALGLQVAIDSVVSVAYKLFNAIDGLGGMTDESGRKVGLFASAWLLLKDVWNGLIAVVKDLGAVFASMVGPVIDMLNSLWETTVSVVNGMTETFTMLWDVVSPIFTYFQAAWEMLVSSFTTEGGVMNDVVKFITESIAFLGQIAGKVFTEMMGVIRSLKPVFEVVFGAIGSLIGEIIKSIIFMSTLLQQVAKGNFRGAVAAANEAVEAYDAKIKEVEERAGEKTEGREAEKKKRADQREGRMSQEPPTPGEAIVGGLRAGADKVKGFLPSMPGAGEGRHVPLAQQKGELIGIVEAWRKAQTAQAETPEQRMERERLELQKTNNKQNDETNDWLRRLVDKPPMIVFG